MKSNQELVTKYQTHKGDTGSPEVQVALLTDKINHLQGHFAKHKLDVHSKFGLMKMINRRRKLLRYLQEVSFDRYKSLIDRLELRK